MSEIYISVDVETDGPIPGPHSMLSIGAAAFLPDRRMVGSFSANLLQLEDAAPNPETEAWWKTQPDAWAACRKDPQPVSGTMVRFNLWVREMCSFERSSELHKPVFVGYPAGFDFTWLYWYLIKFTGHSPFSFSGIDIKTYAAAILGCDYRKVDKRMLARFAQPGLPHTHVAVEDAIEQGYLFLNLREARDKAF